MTRLSPDRRHLLLMLALTFSTGIIDAVGYLGLDRVFTGNMTGNVVILGMAIAGGDDLPIVGPLVALAGFLAGAAFGGRVLRGVSGGWHRRTSAMFTLVAVVLLGAGIALLFIGTPTESSAIPITAALGVAMGVQAATARVIAVKDVTTVVVTSTLTGLAADSVLGAGKRGHAPRRAAAVVLITAGAAAGAVMMHIHLAAGVLLAAAVTLLVTLLGLLGERTPASGGGE